MAYTWTGSSSQPQHVWCAVHVLCSCAHTVSQMDPVHIAFTLSSVQSINYRGNQTYSTWTQRRISGCFWTSHILRLIMGVKRGHAWEHSFVRMIYPKGDFVEVGRYPLCTYGLGHRPYEQNQCFVHPVKESKCLIHDSWTKLRMKSYQSKNAPFKQCNIAPRCINLWSKIKPHDPHS